MGTTVADFGTRGSWRIQDALWVEFDIGERDNYHWPLSAEQFYNEKKLVTDVC